MDIGQVIWFQRLRTFRLDFEARTKFLSQILFRRGYKKGPLQRQFSKAVEKYIVEFQKWALPIDFKAWFDDIVSTDSNINLDSQISQEILLV